MSLLFKNLRIHQIFGANTDVGKTILTSALVRASAASGHNVYYLKPVSTGPMSDADDECVPFHTLIIYAHIFILLPDGCLPWRDDTRIAYEAAVYSASTTPSAHIWLLVAPTRARLNR